MVHKNVFFCAIVSVFIATHGYEQGRIYFVATSLTSILYIHVTNSP